MKQIIAKEKIRPKEIGSPFDCFSNEYTKVYPLAGGLCGTMHTNGVLEKNEMISVDGAANFKGAFKKYNNKVFFDLLFCEGGCIGGPGIASKMPLFYKKKKVLDYTKVSSRGKLDKKRGLKSYSTGLDFSREL
jgi:hypothetical protein